MQLEMKKREFITKCQALGPKDVFENTKPKKAAKFIWVESEQRHNAGELRKFFAKAKHTIEHDEDYEEQRDHMHQWFEELRVHDDQWERVEKEYQRIFLGKIKGTVCGDYSVFEAHKNFAKFGWERSDIRRASIGLVVDKEFVNTLATKFANIFQEYDSKKYRKTYADVEESEFVKNLDNLREFILGGHCEYENECYDLECAVWWLVTLQNESPDAYAELIAAVNEEVDYDYINYC